jgi:hypothetical protein
MPAINIAANLGVSSGLANSVAATLRRGRVRLRAELIGEDTCTALGLTAHGSAPVLALCRVLVGCGYDPASTLEAYRGETLCLTARSIGEAAGLVVENWRFRRVGSPFGAAKRAAVPDSGEE